MTVSENSISIYQLGSRAYCAHHQRISTVYLILTITCSNLLWAAHMAILTLVTQLFTSILGRISGLCVHGLSLTAELE